MEENNLDSCIVPFEQIEEEKPTAEDIIRANIEKANAILDVAALQIADRGKVSSEMLQSVARIIDSVTTAANALISAETDAWGLQIRSDMLKLKERELKFKQLSLNPSRTSPDNVFLGSFNELIGQINRPKEVGDENN